MNASSVVKLLHEKQHILEGMTMNIRVIVLLGALAGLSLHALCIAQEVQIEHAELSAPQASNDQADFQDLADDRFLEAPDQFPDSDFDLGDMDPDDLFAEIQAFEQENPQMDIPLEAKIQLAYEYLKIKANEHKTCILGTVVLSAVALGALCVLYKCYAPKNTTPAQ